MKHLTSIISLLACSALAYENTTLNISASRSISTGGSYTNIGAIVSVGGQVSQVGSLSHQSGFASSFILQPQTAFDVLPDELNPDNDQDGLLDGDEILAGSSLYKADTDDDGLSDSEEVLTYGTSPILADTDSDGMNDADELVAGTSATNHSSVLEVTVVMQPNGEKKLSWFGVHGRSYTFQYCDALDGNNWQSYPFEVSGSDTVISFTDSSDLSNRIYRVKVRIPE